MGTNAHLRILIFGLTASAVVVFAEMRAPRKSCFFKKEDAIIQGYKITLVCDCHSRLVYHGVCYGNGVTYETRTERELSGVVKVNARFKELLEEHGRYAFEVEKTGDFDSLYECLLDEEARIARDDSTHPEKGMNFEKRDAKRMKRALAEHTPGACEDDQWDAAIADFRKNTPDFSPYDTSDNEAALRAYAVAEKCGVATAFANLREAGTLKENLLP